MPVCSGCGASFEEEYKFCPYCGHAKPEPKKINVEVDIKPKKTPYDCPICHHANSVQKVTAIIDANTAEGTERVHTTGSSDYYSTNSGRKIGESELTSVSNKNSFQQSKLAKKLTIPKPPSKPASNVYSPGCWSIGITALVAYFIVYPFSNDSVVIILIGVAILTVILLYILTSLINGGGNAKKKDEEANKKYEKEIEIYDNIRKMWNELYYCHKHDVVFITGKDEYAPADDVWKACKYWNQGMPFQKEIKK